MLSSLLYSGRLLMRERAGSINQGSIETGAGFVEGEFDSVDCGAARDVVTVDGAAEGDCGEEVFGEVLAELTEVGE